MDGKIQQRARENLKYLDSAVDLRDLMIPPANELELLKHDRKGQYSIRCGDRGLPLAGWFNGPAEVNVMSRKSLRPVHPGDILVHDFMKPLKLSAYRLAKGLGVSAPTVNEIARRRRGVTAEMALRLSRYFGTTAQLWQNLQAQYDLEIASSRIGKAVERKVLPLPRPDLPESRTA